MNYEGTVYRPWPEADSLLIQTTIGCTNNQCTFCNMFRDKQFRVRDLDDVFADVDEARRAFPRVNSIFLIDGNVLAVKTVYLVELLENLAEFDCYYWGDHGNNITPMRGRLPEAREWFLTRIERAMTDPAIEQQEVLQTFAW